MPDRARFTDALVLQVYPYASVFLGEEGMLGGEARERIAGFWRALQLEPPTEPDHLTALIGLYVRLCEAQPGAGDEAEAVLLEQAGRSLLWEHLASWGTVFADALVRLGDDFYGAWAELFSATLAAEVERLHGSGQPSPGVPDYLEGLPGLGSDWGEQAQEFPRAVLAPIRTGAVFTRADFSRGASALGLGVRQGERGYILKAMLGQAREETLAWLGDEAVAWSRRHAMRAQAGVPYGAWWRARAEAGAEGLAGFATAPAQGATP